MTYEILPAVSMPGIRAGILNADRITDVATLAEYAAGQLAELQTQVVTY